MKYSIIVAVEDNNGIGMNGKMPWAKGDSSYFKTTTTSHTVLNTIIMGRITYDDITKKRKQINNTMECKSKPLYGDYNIQYLPNRLNIVLSSTINTNSTYKIENGKVVEGVVFVKSLDEIEPLLKTFVFANTVFGEHFIIGGEQLFKMISSHQVDKLYLTKIYESHECDRFFPTIPKSYHLINRSKIVKNCQMIIYHNHQEYQYLDLIQRCLDVSPSDNRTNTIARSIFGSSMEFDLTHSFPLLTTKRVFWKAVVEELLWFIRGETNSRTLEAVGVNIWKDNSTREFLDSRSLNYSDGELGPIYGYQWRHWNGEYPDYIPDAGIDQLQNCIDLIKNDPTSRRIIMSAWNPEQIDMMALPPCHTLVQFKVETEIENGLSVSRLNSALYQRSGDVGLGIPFNIASYALLTIIIARLTGLTAGKFVHFIGDTHVYENHVEPLREQITRIPTAFPTLTIPDVKTLIDVEQLVYDDFKLIGYNPAKTIKMTMS